MNFIFIQPSIIRKLKSNFTEEDIFALLEGIKKVSLKDYKILRGFLDEYKREVGAHSDFLKVLPALYLFFSSMIDQLKTPYPFSSYHKKVREPTDYYQMGLDIFRPLIDFSRSKLHGKENLSLIEKQLKNKENVIFLANHQTEVDPQLIDLLLHDEYPQIAEEMIFVAGERVLTDPSAIPYSLGRNLLCIYSKKYVDNPPEKMAEKKAHNASTMMKLGELLSEGGKAIYVAISGGRDRKSSDGTIIPAAFDPSSVEIFNLIAKKAKQKTHFHPLTLSTYDILPPPTEGHAELGEVRTTKYSPIEISFGIEIDMENFPGSDVQNKKERRKLRSDFIHKIICDEYKKIGAHHA